jgi:hypothetical protein
MGCVVNRYNIDMNKISLAIITLLVITTAGLTITTTRQTAFADRSCSIDPELGTISCSGSGESDRTDTESNQLGRSFTIDEDTATDSDDIDGQHTNPFGELVHEISGKTVCDSESCEIASGSSTR